MRTSQRTVLALFAILFAYLFASIGLSQAASGDAQIPGLPPPPRYVCYRTPEPIVVDGKLDDPAWTKAERVGPWRWLDTDEPARLETYGWMLWDDEYFYFAFEAKDPDIWSTLKNRDDHVYREEDFEIFIDPDGDEYNYYEWQINCLGTIYDVLWTKPPGIPGREWNKAFNLEPMFTGVWVDGTIENREDMDRGWTAEVALSWKGLSEIPGHFNHPPKEGDQWRVGFSRVEKPLPPFWPADWTWPAHGEYSMHIPSRDSYVQFTRAEAGRRTVAFEERPRLLYEGGKIEDAQEGDGNGTIGPGEYFTLIPRLRNASEVPAEGVRATLVTDDSLVTILEPTLYVGDIGPGASVRAKNGFRCRASYAVQPGRTLIFQIHMEDARGTWWGEYFFEFAEGAAWRTFAQIRVGVQKILEDGPTLWGLSRSNVWRWTKDGSKTWFYQADDGLPRHVRELVQDGKGRIWVAGHRGIAYLEEGAWHNLTGKQGFPIRDFDVLCTDSNGEVWIGTREGIFRFDGSVQTVWSKDDGFQVRWVRDMTVDREGQAWIVADSLVYRVKGDDHRTVLGRADGLPGDHGTAVLEDASGAIWVAAAPRGEGDQSGGVARFDGRAWTTWNVEHGLADNAVVSLFADRKGRIWAGHRNGAVSVFDEPFWDHWSTEHERYEFVERTESRAPGIGTPYQFLHDRRNRIWAAGRDGVACYTDGRWRAWSHRNGLPGRGCRGILEDKEGRIWISTGRSLSHYTEGQDIE